MKLPKEISWDVIREILGKQGIPLVLDASPSRSGSGYVNGYRFRTTIFSEGNAGILEIERITTVNVVDDPFVQIISREIFDMDPFCMYKCKNNKGFYIIEWRDLAQQEARYQEIDLMRGTFDLVPLGLTQ